MMEHGASESVKEQPQMKMTIKSEVEVAAISTVHVDSEEPWFVQSVKNEPVLLVKEDILEDNNQDGNEQQCVQGTSAPAGTGGMNEACSTSLGDLLNVKHEMEEMDIGPTVLQHLDIHYTSNKNMSAAVENNTIMDDSNTAMTCKGGKNESVEDKLRDNKTISCKYCIQMKTEDDYDESDLKSCHGQYLLDQHLNTSSSSLKCDFCERTFRRPALSINKKLHQFNEIKTSSADFGLFECHICDAKFGWKSHLANHLKIHTGEKPFQCDKCDAKFTKSCNLTTHIRVHTGEKPYQCDICDARFARSTDLTRHKRVHTGEKPYKCDTCDARFADRSTFTRHTRVHTGKKPYQCDMCDARFAHSSVLTKHVSVHTCEKPFVCSECGSNFSRKDNLNSHMRRHDRY